MTIRTAWFFQAFFKESSLLGPDMDKGLRAGSAGNLEKDRQVRFVSLTTYSYSKFLCTESHFQIKYKVLCFFLYEKKMNFQLAISEWPFLFSHGIEHTFEADERGPLASGHKSRCYWHPRARCDGGCRVRPRDLMW